MHFRQPSLRWRKAGTIHNREMFSSWLREVTFRTALRRGNVAPDPRHGWKFRTWKNLTWDPSTPQVAMNSACSSAQSSIAYPPSTARWCCTPTWKARPTCRLPGCFAVR